MPKHCETVLYAEDGWNKDKILDVIQKHESTKKYVIALHDQDVQEDGTPIKPHLHVYLNFGTTNVQLPQVAKWFGIKEQSVEKIKSDKSDRNQSMGMYYTIRYYTHEDIPEKHHYPLSGFVANFDLEQALKAGAEKLQKRAKGQAKKQEVEEIYNKCADGTITPDNFHDYVNPGLYVTIKPMMERAWQYYDQDYQRNANGSRDCVTIYVHGESGVGKSLLCRLYAQELNVKGIYTTSLGKDPFDEYAGEEAIILDDIRPYMPFSHIELLALTDPHYLVKAHARYKNKLLKNSFLFATSVLDPYALWNGFHLDTLNSESEETDKVDSSKQLFRRLSEVWEVTEGEIYIRKYIDGYFRIVGTIPNPVPSYLAQLPATQGSTLQSTSILDKIRRKYQPPELEQLSLFNEETENLPFP